jgi:aryl-alcohol dehydrogenase-like predicted oxidoreductase
MISKQPFGRTGHMSTRTIFGGWSLAEVTQEEADQTLDVLLEYGLNHIDTAASYGDSELRIGPWMARHRQDFFLATKTGMRTYQEAKEQIHQSLQRLRVDQIDLLQFHYLVDPQEWEIALGPGGALEAAVEAREQGLIRFIGVTGHDVSVARMQIRSLERFDFDSVLLPYNYLMMQNPEYAADFEALLKICRERNVAVQTIKAITRRPSWGQETQTHHTWYKPLEDQAAIERAVRWVLARPGIFLNTAGDIYLLPKILEAASRFAGDRPSDQEMEQDIARLGMEPVFS